MIEQDTIKDIRSGFEWLSGLFTNPDLIVYSAIGIAGYIILFLILYIFYVLSEYHQINQLKSILKKRLPNEEKYLKLKNYVGIATSDSKGNSRNNRTRIRKLLVRFFHTFESVDSNQHYTEDVLPIETFFKKHLTESRISIVGAFDILIRISLAVTFAGLAAILFTTGLEIEDISKNKVNTFQNVGQLKTTDNNSSTTQGDNGVDKTSKKPKTLSDAVLKIISSAASKFWITATGYGLGLLMYIIYLIFENILISRLVTLANRLEPILHDGEVMDHIKKDKSSLSTNERNKLSKALLDNIESIGKLGEKVNDDLIDKLGNMVSDNKLVVDAILEHIHNQFKVLQERGIALPVQKYVSEEISLLIKNLTDDVSHSTNVNAKILEIAEKYIDFMKDNHKVDEKPKPRGRPRKTKNAVPLDKKGG